MLVNLDDACFNNLKDCWVALGKSVKSTPDAVSIETGIEIPLFNPIFLTSQATALPKTTSFGRHSIWYDTKRNQNVPQHALQHLEPIMEKVPVMTIALDKSFIQEPKPRVSIHQLANSADLSDWVLPVQTAFGLDDAFALIYRTALESAAPQFIHFIAKVDDKIVGAASLFLHKEIAGLYNLAVLPDHRHQGIGTALHFARLNEARARGYQHATLQATPMAAHLDQALGFETRSEISIFKM